MCYLAIRMKQRTCCTEIMSIHLSVRPHVLYFRSLYGCSFYIKYSVMEFILDHFNSQVEFCEVSSAVIGSLIA
jgi:uncharacterized membrane protein